MALGGVNEEVERILKEAINAKARASGLTPREKRPPAEGGINQVTLATPSGQGRMYIMPRTPYYIRAFAPVSVSDFSARSPRGPRRDC